MFPDPGARPLRSHPSASRRRNPLRFVLWGISPLSAFCLLPFHTQPLLAVRLIKSLTVRQLKTAPLLPFRSPVPQSGSATVPIAPVGVSPTEPPPIRSVWVFPGFCLLPFHPQPLLVVRPIKFLIVRNLRTSR